MINHLTTDSVLCGTTTSSHRRSPMSLIVIMIEDLQSRLTYALDARKMNNVGMRSADGNNN